LFIKKTTNGVLKKIDFCCVQNWNATEKSIFVVFKKRVQITWKHWKPSIAKKI